MLNRMDDLTYGEQIDRRATVLPYTLIAIKGTWENGKMLFTWTSPAGEWARGESFGPNDYRNMANEMLDALANRHPGYANWSEGSEPIGQMGTVYTLNGMSDDAEGEIPWYTVVVVREGADLADYWKLREDRSRWNGILVTLAGLRDFVKDTIASNSDFSLPLRMNSWHGEYITRKSNPKATMRKTAIDFEWESGKGEFFRYMEDLYGYEYEFESGFFDQNWYELGEELDSCVEDAFREENKCYEAIKELR